MNCNYKVKITDIQTKYKFKVFCTGYDDSEIKEKIDAMYQAWPKASAEGETPTLDNTVNATMSIDLKGNTSQEGTPTPETPQDIHVVSGDNTINICGKNLCPVSSSNFVPIATWSSLTGGNANTYTNGTKITLNSGTYTITFSERTNIDGIQVNGLTPVLYGNGTFTIDTKTDIYIRVKAQNNSNPVILKTQLEKGSTATEFVPNELQSYPVNLGVENLFDKDNVVSGKRLDASGVLYNDNAYSTSDFIKISSSSDYSFTKLLASEAVCIYDNNKTFIRRIAFDSQEHITTNAGEVYFRVGVLNSRLDIFEMTKGDHTQYISTTPIELCKIGDYQDYFYKDSDKWYLHKEIGKVVLNGSENWKVANTGTPNWYYYLSYTTNYVSGKGAYSNYYTFANISNTNTDNGFNVVGAYFRIRYGEEDTTTNFKQWLSTHNVIIQYPTYVPTGIEITDTTLISQLEVLKEAESYSGQTNISQTNYDKPFILTVKALKDLSNLGTSTVSTLNTANVNRSVFNQSIDPVNLEMNSEDLELNNEEEIIEETPEER